MKSISADLKASVIQKIVNSKVGMKESNSFFDISYCDKNPEGKHPTLVYFHGGGYLFGSKCMGDPLAVQGAGESVLEYLRKEGLNIVNVDYCFATKYRAPAQLHQINELFFYLREHRNDLHLDMEHVFIMGGSAGATFTEIIDESALAMAQQTDKNAMTLCRSWLGERDIAGSDMANLLEVSKHITDTYPPVFINSSNLESWFPSSANALIDALKAKKLPYDSFYVPQEVEKLEHGFLNRFAESPSAAKCLEQIITFIHQNMD